MLAGPALPLLAAVGRLVARLLRHRLEGGAAVSLGLLSPGEGYVGLRKSGGFVVVLGGRGGGAMGKGSKVRQSVSAGAMGNDWWRTATAVLVYSWYIPHYFRVSNELAVHAHRIAYLWYQFCRLLCRVRGEKGHASASTLLTCRRTRCYVDCCMYVHTYLKQVLYQLYNITEVSNVRAE